MSIRFVDEHGNPAEYKPAPQPPYHLLVVGAHSRKAYDKEGNEVDERTGALIAKAKAAESVERDPDKVLAEQIHTVVQTVRKRGRPKVRVEHG